MRELKAGEVRVSYGNNGNSIDEVEMLLLPKAKINLALDGKSVLMNISDTDFDNSNLSGSLSLEVLDVLIKQLIKMRNQIIER